MRPRARNILLCAGAFFLFAISHISFAADASETEKIKIISAYCLNGIWNFNVYDGVKDKTSTAVLGRRNAQGIMIEKFDEASMTAIVSTPRGRFKVALQTPTNPVVQTPAESDKKTPQPNQSSASETPQNTSSESDSPAQNISRRDMLKMMK